MIETVPRDWCSEYELGTLPVRVKCVRFVNLKSVGSPIELDPGQSVSFPSSSVPSKDPVPEKSSEARKLNIHATPGSE